jgi:hypothetical protein
LNPQDEHGTLRWNSLSGEDLIDIPNSQGIKILSAIRLPQINEFYLIGGQFKEKKQYVYKYVEYSQPLKPMV